MKKNEPETPEEFAALVLEYWSETEREQMVNDGHGCACHLHPPCSFCTASTEEDEAKEMVPVWFKEAMNYARQNALPLAYAECNALKTRIDEMGQERDDAVAQAERLLDTFHHTHKGPGDLCRQCGLDIRHAVHSTTS